MRSVVLLSLLVSLSFVKGALEDLECPFPEGQGVSSSGECAKYTACQWDGIKCHMKDQNVAGYRVVSDPVNTGRGFQVMLQKYDPASTLFDGDVTNLVFEVINHEGYHVQVKIYDADASRYEVPVPLTLPETADAIRMQSVTVSANGQPFQFTVTRDSTGAEIFKTLGALTFEDQFIQIHTQLASTFLYGFGESTHTSFRHPFSTRRTFAMYARDLPVKDYGEFNEYGVQPYYMVMEDDLGNSHSVLLFNSNAMEYSTFTQSEGTPTLTLRAIGGIIDLHFFTGPMPEDLTVQYTNMVGKPSFPPYWSLGFHLSRWGYWTSQNFRAVWDRMKAENIPQDVQTFDIDYMYRYRDFTYDSVSWADLPQLIQELHDANMKVTLILDPGVVIDFANYPPGQRGKDADVYIKWMDPQFIPSDQPPDCGDYVVGYCWPDTKTVYPDFFKPQTSTWWQGELELLKQVLPYDAIWIDMNEPANFGTDLNKPWNYPPELPDWSLKCPYTKYDSPPYTTKTTFEESKSGRISDHSMCMSTHQTDGTTTYLHYDVHSLFGWSQSVATYKGLEQVFPGKRPVVLSRSTFPGSGQYVVHWLGDNSALWSHMHMGIIGMFEFNMFGIPMVGADICGFFDTPSEEMCARWMEVGAFYPFSRNHNAENLPDQDPAAWPSVAAISRDYLGLRYKFIPYLYVLFHNAHMNGNSVVRPYLNIYPTDVFSRDIDDQFFWGDAIMVAPVIQEFATSRDVYFGQGNWYDLKSGALSATGPTTLTVNVPLEFMPVYVRGGKILPYQEPAVTTVESRQNPFGFLIALDESMNAAGEVFWDDGELIHVMADTFLALLNFDGSTFTMAIQHGATAAAGVNIGTVQFYGFPNNPTAIDLNGTPLAPASWTFDAGFSVLTVIMNEPLGQAMSLQLTY